MMSDPRVSATPFDMKAWELPALARHDPQFLGVWNERDFIQSQKFLFGPHAEIPEEIVWFGDDLLRKGVFRLPFRRTLMEFKTNAEYDGDVDRIVLLCEQVDVGPHPEMPPVVVMVFPLARGKNGRWWYAGGGKCKAHPIIIGSGRPAERAECRFGPEYTAEWEQMALHAGALCPAGTVMLMSKSCDRADVDVPHRLQAARVRQDKEPLVSFTVVRLPAQSIAHQPGIGTHASLRLHWRRGHYRRLPEKIVPVAPCLVGLAENGAVEHVYDVEP